MITRTLFLIGLLLACIGCETGDFVEPAGTFISELSTGSDPGSPYLPGSRTKSDSCIEVVSIHWLTGTQGVQALPETESHEIHGGRSASKRYVIKGKGDAMSEQFTRGLSDLSLLYEVEQQRVSGTLVTQFFHGEILELKLKGAAQIRYEDGMMDLEVDISGATMRTETGLFELASGVINITLPVKPEGVFNIEILANVLLCR